MAVAYFLDTCALIHRYVSGPFSRLVRRIVSSDRWPVYVAEPTVLEMASALARQCRSHRWDVHAFDALDRRFFQDIAFGRLRVRAVTKQEVLRARHLLRYAGVVKGNKLESADALIAVTCLELAYEVKERVVFYTQDWPLYATIRGVDAFRAMLELRFLGPGRGGVPPTTKKGS